MLPCPYDMAPSSDRDLTRPDSGSMTLLSTVEKAMNLLLQQYPLALTCRGWEPPATGALACRTTWRAVEPSVGRPRTVWVQLPRMIMSALCRCSAGADKY